VKDRGGFHASEEPQRRVIVRRERLVESFAIALVGDVSNDARVARRSDTEKLDVDD
jgi:hypothetical protein